MIKGRTVANGSKQRAYLNKEDMASPTVSIEALLLTLITDAMEDRDVACADVTGAYLHAEMKDFVLLKLSGHGVDVLCQIDEKYKNFVIMEGGRKTLYLKLLRALYGCMQSEILS